MRTIAIASDADAYVQRNAQLPAGALICQRILRFP
jgi:hypothetical protein